ncbi:MAG: site-specific integrase [Bacteroidales bacterium]|nr:site-specific integrase [Bacteroidales bacterium]
MKKEKKTQGPTLLRMVMRLTGEYSDQGKVSTARNYMAVARQLKKHGMEELTLAEVTGATMAKLQSAMAADGLCPNSIACYMRKLRHAYFVAVAEGLVRDTHPFYKIPTASTPTVKRSLRPEQMKSLRQLKLTDPQLAFARDIFLFLFYCQGISFVDASNLLKTDVCGESFTYRRQKTGQLIYVKLVPQAREIIKRLTVKDSPYLLPLLNNPADPIEKLRQRNSMHRRINRNLKILAKMADLPGNLTTYVARHSWATGAYWCDVSVSVISASLGHTSERTTRIYLADLNHGSLDAATLAVANMIE